MAIPIELRDELVPLAAALDGTAWLNSPPDDEDVLPPYMVAYLVTTEILTVDDPPIKAYDYRVDCLGSTFVAAQALADAIRLKDDWPWPVFPQSEKDEYVAPQDGGDVLHIVSVHFQIIA